MQLVDIPKIDSAKIEDTNLVIITEGNELRYNVRELSERLEKASIKDLNVFRISPSGYGIHWPNLDEDISLTGLINKAQKNHGA